MLEQAKLQVATAGVHSKTGLHHPEVEDMFSSYALSQSSTSSSDGPASYTPNPPIDVLDMNGEEANAGSWGMVGGRGAGEVNQSQKVLYNQSHKFLNKGKVELVWKNGKISS